jgi:hypothetical protein
MLVKAIGAVGCVVLGISAFCVKRFYFGDPYDNIELANRVLGYYCDENKPVFETKELAWAATLRANWRQIRAEYEQYAATQTIPFFRDVNHNNSLWGDASNWRTLILRTFCLDTRVSDYFPRTLQLVDEQGSVENGGTKTLVMFSLLEPGTKLPPHNGIYRGVLRHVLVSFLSFFSFLSFSFFFFLFFPFLSFFFFFFSLTLSFSFFLFSLL